MSEAQGQDLRSLLQGDRETAKRALIALEEASKRVESHIKEEMEEKHGFVWKSTEASSNVILIHAD
ncbi:14292_t:CDS:2 [Acaulospora colombiana]|uniref:14292_t:CDS:1 n=1 Tax=Acaulospora colombiana TaxID=27376 RepID=A0ACA9QKX7_9GLOM|nr:14292_t:CDS:2 [Acaulospora colombiana]